LTLLPILGVNMATKILPINFRATRRDAALLALVAARVQRSRSDTLRLLIRSAAAELDATPAGQQGVQPQAGQGVSHDGQ
jgi:hypothetical protein